MNVLIVGLGSIALKHYYALKSLEKNIKILALRSKKNCNSIDGIDNIFSLTNLNEKIDFAIISNPTFKHIKSIKDLIFLNIPLMIEKPLSHNLEGVLELDKVLLKNNITTYIACNLRFHPCINFLKNNINKLLNEINEVNVYCGSYLPNWRDEDYKNNYSSISSMGGGVHLDLIHEIDYVSWIFGLPESQNSYNSNKSNLNIDSVDYANYVLNYKNFNVSVILNYYRPIPKRTIEIICYNDIWEIDLINNTVIKNNEIVFQEKNYNLNETYEKQLKYFMKCISDFTKPMNSFNESINVLKICLNK